MRLLAIVSLLHVTHVRCGIVLCSRDAKFAVDCDTCRLSYCLVCLASGSKDPCVRCGHLPSKRMEQLVHLRLKSIYKAFKQSNVRAAANVRERQNDDPDESHVAEDPEALLQAAASAAKNIGAASKATHKHRKSKTSSANLEEKMAQYLAEKERADAAAAALLAELEEEEEAEKSKKKKKKKKKERQQAKRDEEKKKEPLDEDDEEYDDEEGVEYDDGDGDMEDLKQGTAQSSEKERLEVTPIHVVAHSEAKQCADPLESQLTELIEGEDVEGLEALLSSVKGIPGHAALRKNAKKAIKRLRHEMDPEAESDAVVPEEEPILQPTASRPGAQTPVTQSETSSRNSDLLRIVSQTKQSSQSNVPGRRGSANSGRTECIMEMSPTIVGWVIGKGGQRIRDMMEESGARIWIDQDNKAPSDPRKVYVSGQRTNVDTAVHLIADLVSKAPASTPLSKHATPVPQEVANAKPPMSARPPNFPDAESLGVAHAGVDLRPRGSNADGSKFRTLSPTSCRTEQVMTCDSRFVPLLIGRRGWTIKNIQDSSGARVDIDQTVTPRKITVSGTEENVQVAVKMVRDVLSYPHAQLQGVEVDPKVGRIDPKVAESELSVEVSPPPHQSSPPERRHGGAHSPPSSLIMPGDAKSTISASSSLSSTPEPSMASSITKGALSQIPPGPMLPPAFGFGQQTPMAADRVGHISSQPSDGHLFSPGMALVPSVHENLYGLNSPLGNASHGLINAGAHASGDSVLVGDLSSEPRLAGASTFVNQSVGASASSGLLVGIPGLQPRGSFQPPAVGVAGLMNGGPSIQQLVDNGPLPSHSLWNAGGPAVGTGPQSVQSPTAESFQMDAAMAFLQNTKRATSVGHVVGGMRNSIGSTPAAAPVNKPRMGISRGLTAPTSISNTGPDESLIVDSLFGPSNGVECSPGLLSSLGQLSIGTDPLQDTGLWGSSVEQANPFRGVTPDEPTRQPVFDSVVGNEQRQPQSRFAWGGFVDGQH